MATATGAAKRPGQGRAPAKPPAGPPMGAQAPGKAQAKVRASGGSSTGTGPAMRQVRLALTGTPGTGKTTLAGLCRDEGWHVVDVKAWARAAGAVADYDAHDQADVVDMGKLRRAFRSKAHGQEASATGAPVVVYEGHLSHFLPTDVVWVVRCDPHVLRPRLQARGYPPPKVRENLEAEALDLILQEALEATPCVVQRDGTRRTPTQLFSAFAGVPFDSLKEPDLERVDWSAQLPFEW